MTLAAAGTASAAPAHLRWSAPEAIDPAGFGAISCTSGLCVATDRAGGVVAVTHPTGTPLSWDLTNIDGKVTLGAISCASTSFCLAGANDGSVFASTDPADPVPTWTRADPTGPLHHGVQAEPARGHPPTPGYELGPGVRGISCPSSTLCVAALFSDFNDSIVTGIARSSDPAGGTAAWNEYDGFGSGLTFEAASCPALALCVLVDQSGTVAWSRHPTSGGWNVVQADKLNAMTGVSCPTAQLCVAVDLFGNVITSKSPTRQTWKAERRVDGYHAFTGVSCPSSGMCIAIDRRGDVFGSSRPTGGRRAWRVVDRVGRMLTSVSCASTSLCVATTRAGELVVGSASG